MERLLEMTVCKKDGEVARNHHVWELPSHIEPKDKESLYHGIRDTLLKAVQEAMHNFHKMSYIPWVTFLCPKQTEKCSHLPHPALIDDAQTSLKCSIKPGSVSHPLTDEQKLWLLSVHHGKFIIPSVEFHVICYINLCQTCYLLTLCTCCRFLFPNYISRWYIIWSLFSYTQCKRLLITQY